MLTNLHKTPFPYFGGKADAADIVWTALGDVEHYVEPFAGSLAVLLRRPHLANRGMHSETVNDADGLLVNAWRGIQLSPEATADAASWPVTEADLMARHLAILRWKQERELERLMADPEYHDPKIAGWWMWGISSWIGGGWCNGSGPWIVGADGRITRREKGEPGVSRKLPHISTDGQGVNRPNTRAPGVGDFHPMTMPELRRWFDFLSARLRHVRILNGDWKRATTGGATLSLSVRNGGVCGVFLDPPYSAEAERTDGCYAVDDLAVAHEARAWALKAGADPRYRIVLAGYDVEHRELEDQGWTVREWFKGGMLKGGMGNTATGEDGGHQQHRERLWLSPHCLRPADTSQIGLFGGGKA